MGFQMLAAGSAHALSGQQGLAQGEMRSAAREAKVAALGAALTRAFRRPLCEFGVDGPHFRESRGTLGWWMVAALHAGRYVPHSGTVT
jgi:hypothetical protein